MAGAILTLNAGSSSIKFTLYDTARDLVATATGEVEGLSDEPRFRARDMAGAVISERRWPAGEALPFAAALGALLDFATSHVGVDGLLAAGHRVVHGGASHIKPKRVTPMLIDALESLTSLDPLHMPANLAAIRALAIARPGLPQVVCFDTAFHHTIPPIARHIALPRAITDTGVRGYGFHGLSYEFISRRLREIAPALVQGRVIVAHLGAGDSLCAMQGGESVATTMSFSALDGLVMATRCGHLDPGVVLHLLREGHDLADLEDMLYRRSGLLGVSGLSGDTRVLGASDDPRAREALDLFTYRIAIEIGGLVSALGGIDGLVFTAGIGENSPSLRAAICGRLAWLGLRLDEAANTANASRISTPSSPVEVRVIATDEDAMIARHARDVLGI
jgi:acetate kinase